MIGPPWLLLRPPLLLLLRRQLDRCSCRHSCWVGEAEALANGEEAHSRSSPSEAAQRVGLLRMMGPEAQTVLPDQPHATNGNVDCADPCWDHAEVEELAAILAQADPLDSCTTDLFLGSALFEAAEAPPDGNPVGCVDPSRSREHRSAAPQP